MGGGGGYLGNLACRLVPPLPLLQAIRSDPYVLLSLLDIYDSFLRNFPSFTTSFFLILPSLLLLLTPFYSKLLLGADSPLGRFVPCLLAVPFKFVMLATPSD